ncbi:hypothetical protein EIN_390650 [Entamoeba invadens IP1]|uniref:Uncharacterized protein n=1 Tax=Entamoeba invadens IP1 TaxID=370355 RepID=A0A0A1U555_ENTIV|nr:hypothetical protein EIN_390650 [Entamoeba invadens IP1]ELP89440.1 hypothetical protein EIN_390650 [Entamoeba invadens IP1]|eukprot:XP_004256211.1 hypothetical protein EIN_390650 [Entamoeba invadens IP1]
MKKVTKAYKPVYITKKERQKAKTRRRMDAESCLVSYVIALLSKDNEIVINLPHTHTSKTLPFPNIASISSKDGRVDFQNYIKKRLYEKMELEKTMGRMEKTVIRRTQNYRRKEIIEYIEDLLYIQTGIIVFHQLEKAQLIFINKGKVEIVATNKVIVENGHKISTFIETELNEKKMITLRPEDYSRYTK